MIWWWSYIRNVKNGPLGYFGTGGAIYCYGNSGLVLEWKRLRIVAMHNLKFLLKISYVDWATMRDITSRKTWEKLGKL